MIHQLSNRSLFLLLCMVWLSSCKIPAISINEEKNTTPAIYTNSSDTTNLASIQWKSYFKDSNLVALIDTALSNNQELNIALREIEIGKNEIMARKGEYLPFVNVGGAAGIDKSGKFTFNGMSEEDIKNNPTKNPTYIGDFMIGAYASWELDIWKKLHNAKKSAVMKYLSSIEGKNFMVTNIIAEIASSYYELMALDNLLSIVQQNILIQDNALQVVKLEKESAKVTQLAVNRFEAQLLNTKNLQYEIQQRIIETENTINFLAGRYPQHIKRNAMELNAAPMGIVQSGVPSQLLGNRPDIRQAEFDLAAAKLDVQVARANFYPSARLVAGIGLNAFNPAYIFKPESILTIWQGIWWLL